MSYINQFIQINQLQPADAIVLKKKGLGLLNHYAVYLGYSHKYGHRFAANYTKGVQVLENHKIEHFLTTLEPTNIERFEGGENDRKNAVKRALKYVGKTSYNLIFHNCEHYKNIVQFGKKYSKQVDDVGDALLSAGAVTGVFALSTKNNKAGNWALGLLALGLIAKAAAGNKE